MKRTQNAIRNMISGFLYKIIVLIFPFIIRSVMINKLGSEYLGLNSLFTSILQVLNLAELGFSSAVVYNMYRPIAEKNEGMICALMNLYKKIYRYMGITIISLGLLLLPFLKFFISGSYPNNINLYLLYIIYLINTGLTYFLFSYKGALLNAHQRNDIVSNVHSVTSVLQYIIQIVILIIFKNYYLFISVQVITTVLNNILIAFMANKKYPNYKCYGEVDNCIKREIKKSISGLMVQRICSATRNSLDSIFISSFLGLNVVAIYSNYYSIMYAIIGIMGIITTAIIAGIGNSIVTETEKKNYDDMNKFNFIYMWLSGLCTICLACLFQPFMKLWMGEKYMFPYGVVLLFCIYFYALKMGDIRAAYSDAKGLWYENRYRAIVESIANIILNALLGYWFGIYGIIAGTLISLLIINFGYGSQILFQHYFINEKISDYFIRHGLYIIVTLFIAVITYFVCSLIRVTGMLEILFKLMICIIIPNLMYYFIYFKTKIFKDSSIIIKRVFHKYKNN